MLKETTINGFPAVVYVPDNVIGKLPALIFYPGRGEAASKSVSSLYIHGPARFLKGGFAPKDLIIIAIEDSYAYARDFEVNKDLDEIVKTYPVDEGNIFLSGLSAGGWVATYYTFISEANAKRLKGLVLMSYQPSDGNTPDHPEYIINNKIAFWGICGDHDSFYAKNKALAAKVGGVFTTIAGAGHSGAVWEKCYDPAYKDATTGTNIYDWVVSKSSLQPAPQPQPSPTPSKNLMMTIKIYDDGSIEKL